jgi:hypothetical protein
VEEIWLMERSLLLFNICIQGVSRSENVSRENVPGGRSGRREEDHNEPDDDTMQVGGCHRRDPWS